MDRNHTTVFVLLAALAWTSPAAAQVELTEESVQAAMEAPDFVQAFGACFAGIDHPAEVTLVLIINEQGGASLSKAEPMLLPETTGCLGQAVGKLAFPATGNNFEITYPLAVPDVAAGASTTTHPVVQAKPVYAVQPATAVVVQDDSWKPIHRSGTKKIVVGAVLLGVGGVVLALPGAILLAYGFLCQDLSGWSEGCRTIFSIPGGILLTSGLILMIIGIVNIAKGKRLRAKAAQMRAGTGFLPRFDIGLSPDGRGGSMLLTWRF